MSMGNDQQEALHEQDLQRLRGFRLMDDDFMTAFFKDDVEDVEFILRIILERPDLKVESVVTQYVLKNLNGRSVRLDIKAVDSENSRINIEVQRADKGAGFKRARHNSSLLDASILKPRQDPEELPETYVIFITENDVIGLDEPIYPIERYICVKGKYIPVNDGAHTIYVNGAKQGNETELEKLMHDFSCVNADDMYFQQLANKMRYFKENEKGVEAMCKVMEDMRNDVRIAIALKFLAMNKLSMEEIAEGSDLPLEKVKELAEQNKIA